MPIKSFRQKSLLTSITKNRSTYYKTFTAMTLATILSACGGGGGGGSSSDDDTGPSSTALSGSAVKGPLSLADVTVYEYDSTAPENDFKGDQVDTGTTNEQAQITGVSLPFPLNPPYILEVTSNAETIDITTGEAPVITTLRTVLTESIINSGEPIYATPLSTLVVDRALGDAPADADAFDESLADAGDEVKSTLGFGLDEDVDLLTTPPIVTDSTTSADDQAEVAAFRAANEALTAIAFEINQQSGSGNVNDVLGELADDLADDGEIDGSVSDGQIDSNTLQVLQQDPSTLPIPNDDENRTVGQIQEILVEETESTGFDDVDVSAIDDGGEVDITETLEVPTVDSDLDDDGTLNANDDFPNNDAADTDTDGDGQPDTFLASCDSDCQDNSGLVEDTDDDNDGYLDTGSAAVLDDFPLDPSRFLDPAGDRDSDTILNDLDNCVFVANADQTDTDTDGTGDACSDDRDGDGVEDEIDNCPDDANPSQDNFDQDAFGDACDADIDGDEANNENDAFPYDPSETTDTDGDGIGNNEDEDDDNDGISDFDEENSKAGATDPLNPDTDGDGALDGADFAPLDDQIQINFAPIAADDNVSADEDTTNIQLDVLANDTDDGVGTPLGELTITEVGDNDTSIGNVELNDNSLIYEPLEDVSGTDTFTYTVSDGDKETTATVTVTINPVNDAPESDVDEASTAEDTQVITPNLLANDRDIEGDTLSIGSFDATSVEGGSVSDNGDGTFTYVPPLNFNGEDSFTYTASDGVDEGDASLVIITVSPVNDGPVAVNDTESATEDTLLVTGNLLTNDTDIDTEIAQLFVGAFDSTSAEGGSVASNGDGTFNYTPAANFNGADSFTYTVSDGEFTSVGTVSITIDAVNDVPVGNADEGSAAVGLTANLNVLANDSDVDGDSLTITAVSAGSRASIISIADSGTSIDFTDDTGSVGTTTFTYDISDGNGGTVEGIQVSVSVTENLPPVATDDSLTVDEDTFANTVNVLSNDTDGGDGPAALAITDFDSTSANGGSVTNNEDGTFGYIPAANFFGNDSFTYTVSDTTGTDIGTVNITVNPVNDAPEGSVSITGTAAAGEVLTASNNLSDADDLGTISYEWFVAGVSTGVTETNYTVQESDEGSNVSVVASYEDGSGNQESVESDAILIPNPISDTSELVGSWDFHMEESDTYDKTILTLTATGEFFFFNINSSDNDECRERGYEYGTYDIDGNEIQLSVEIDTNGCVGLFDDGVGQVFQTISILDQETTLLELSIPELESDETFLATATRIQTNSDSIIGPWHEELTEGGDNNEGNNLSNLILFIEDNRFYTMDADPTNTSENDFGFGDFTFGESGLSLTYRFDGTAGQTLGQENSFPNAEIIDNELFINSLDDIFGIGRVAPDLENVDAPLAFTQDELDTGFTWFFTFQDTEECGDDWVVEEMTFDANGYSLDVCGAGNGEEDDQAYQILDSGVVRLVVFDEYIGRASFDPDTQSYNVCYGDSENEALQCVEDDQESAYLSEADAQTIADEQNSGDSDSGDQTFFGTGSGSGTLSFANDNCRIELGSNTTALTLDLVFQDDILTEGTYTLDISTEKLSDIKNTTDGGTCDGITFDESYTGSVSIIGNTIEFDTSIGTSEGLSGVNYAFFGEVSEDAIEGTATHSSPSLLSDIVYDISLALQTGGFTNFMSGTFNSQVEGDDLPTVFEFNSDGSGTWSYDVDEGGDITWSIDADGNLEIDFVDGGIEIFTLISGTIDSGTVSIDFGGAEPEASATWESVSQFTAEDFVGAWRFDNDPSGDEIYYQTFLTLLDTGEFFFINNDENIEGCRTDGYEYGTYEVENDRVLLNATFDSNGCVGLFDFDENETTNSLNFDSFSGENQLEVSIGSELEADEIEISRIVAPIDAIYGVYHEPFDLGGGDPEGNGLSQILLFTDASTFFITDYDQDDTSVNDFSYGTFDFDGETGDLTIDFIFATPEAENSAGDQNTIEGVILSETSITFPEEGDDTVLPRMGPVVTSTDPNIALDITIEVTSYEQGEFRSADGGSSTMQCDSNGGPSVGEVEKFAEWWQRNGSDITITQIAFPDETYPITIDLPTLVADFEGTEFDEDPTGEVGDIFTDTFDVVGTAEWDDTEQAFIGTITETNTLAWSINDETSVCITTFDYRADYHSGDLGEFLDL